MISTFKFFIIDNEMEFENLAGVTLQGRRTSPRYSIYFYGMKLIMALAWKATILEVEMKTISSKKG